jgi:hypothetical protein
MLKKFVFIFCFLSTSAFAADLSCRESGKASGQGFELIVSGKTAKILKNNKVIGKLKQISDDEAPVCCDVISETEYSDGSKTGAGASIWSGGISGKTSAKIWLNSYLESDPPENDFELTPGPTVRRQIINLNTCL